MKVHFNMAIEDFLQDVRDRACQANAGPAFIDKIDQLLEGSTREAEIENLGDELCETEKERDDLLEELEALYAAALDNDDLSVKHPAMIAADNAIQRHSKA